METANHLGRNLRPEEIERVLRVQLKEHRFPDAEETAKLLLPRGNGV